MFLYGYPGNGKTSIAERITRCFGTTRLDPQGHRRRGPDHQALRPGQPRADRAPTAPGLLARRRLRPPLGRDPPPDDRRRRRAADGGPGDPLRPGRPRSARPRCSSRATLGTFLIDDFGRQRMQPIELLNRWIVPLEKRYDFLSLANGKKIRVPFDQLILFSTNLEPKQLVDEAFLRRIPYKIHAADPTEAMFRQMLDDLRPQAGLRRGRPGGGRLPDRPPLPAGQPAVPLLPAARPAAPGPQLLHLQRPAAGAEARVLRLRRDELLHGHVSRPPRRRPSPLQTAWFR